LCQITGSMLCSVSASCFALVTYPDVQLMTTAALCRAVKLTTELHRNILLRSDIFVEYLPQTQIEGEIQQLPTDHEVTELWRVVYGTTKGRSSLCDPNNLLGWLSANAVNITLLTITIKPLGKRILKAHPSLLAHRHFCIAKKATI
jgi:hypothetical protein